MKDKIDRLVEPASGWEEDPVEKSKEDFCQVKWLGGIRKIFLRSGRVSLKMTRSTFVSF